MKLSDDALRGRTVIASDGLAIGEVAVSIIDAADWRVDALQVRLRREVADRVGADRGVFHAATLAIPTGLVQSVGDAVVLSVGIDELRELLPGGSESARVH